MNIMPTNCQLNDLFAFFTVSLWFFGVFNRASFAVVVAVLHALSKKLRKFLLRHIIMSFVSFTFCFLNIN